jgi:hypothetical protein
LDGLADLDSGMHRGNAAGIAGIAVFSKEFTEQREPIF